MDNMQMDEFEGVLDALKGGDALTEGQKAQLADVLINIANALVSYREVIGKQQMLLGKATRAYKRFHSYPKGVDPDPARVLQWLMDANGRKQAMELRETIEEMYGRLADLGPLSFDKQYSVDGQWLIALRTRAKNAITVVQSEHEDVSLAFPTGGRDSIIRTID